MSDLSSPNVIGIAAEFDPFHEGHRRLIDQARRALSAEGIVAVMSGDFTQRGTPAVFDKWKRAEEAVKGGVDLVLELPFLWACADAGTFARGAVAILAGTGVVTHMAFGTESGDLGALTAALDRIEQVESSDLLREKLAEGLSYPAARQQALEALYPDADREIYGQPNNILALEYLRALRAAGCPMTPFTVKREGEGHHETATAIREALRREDPLRWAERDRRAFDLLRARVLTADPEALEREMGDGEGLSNRLLREIRTAEDRDDLIARLKSRRYTWSGISRMQTRVLLGVGSESCRDAAIYIRPLAFSDRGAALLRRAKREERLTLPVVGQLTRALKEEPALSTALEAEIRAADVYALIEGADLYRSCDLVRGPVYVR